MKRALLAFFAGLAAWIVVVSLLNRALRILLAGYAAAEPQMTFTLGMMIGRLAIAAVTSLVAGAIVGLIARSSRAAWALGALLLAGFLPEHIHLWHRFPIWYHLTFLLTLVPLIVIGDRIGRRAGVARGVRRDEDVLVPGP